NVSLPTHKHSVMPQFQLRSILRMAWWTVTFRFVPRVRGVRARRRCLELLASSTLFDRNWYLDHYPDVRATGIDPALHYLSYGAGEGRDPSPHFDTRWYLDSNPDVCNAGVNPLVHYLRFGTVEGRRRKETNSIGQAIQHVLSDKGPDGEVLGTADIPANSVR